jgi:hypothetical protein
LRIIKKMRVVSRRRTLRGGVHANVDAACAAIRDADTKEAASKVFREASRQFHPDKQGGSTAAQQKLVKCRDDDREARERAAAAGADAAADRERVAHERAAREREERERAERAERERRERAARERAAAAEAAAAAARQRAAHEEAQREEARRRRAEVDREQDRLRRVRELAKNSRESAYRKEEAEDNTQINIATQNVHRDALAHFRYLEPAPREAAARRVSNAYKAQLKKTPGSMALATLAAANEILAISRVQAPSHVAEIQAAVERAQAAVTAEQAAARARGESTLSKKGYWELKGGSSRRSSLPRRRSSSGTRHYTRRR